MTLRLLWPVGLLCLLWTCLSPDLAFAQSEADRAQARTEFEQGRAAFDAGSHEVALQHFQEAYRLAPHPNVRLNMANCYDLLDRPVEALFHYEAVVTEGGLAGAQRREVDAAVRRLRARVGSIALLVTPDGALITIDGTEQRRAPVAEPVRVVAGSHQIEVRLEGYQPETQTVEVAGGATARVSLRLRRAEAVAVVAETPAVVATTAGPDAAPTPDPSSDALPSAGPVELSPAATEPTAEASSGLRINVPVIIGASVTVGALIVAAVLGPLALVENDRFELNVRQAHDPLASLDERARAVREGESAASNAGTYAVVTDVMLITAAVAGGATIAFFVFAQEEEREAPSVALLPVIAPDYAGVLALGAF